MTEEQADKPIGKDWSVRVNREPPVTQPEKCAKGDWAVTVNPGPAAARKASAAPKPHASGTPRTAHKSPLKLHHSSGPGPEFPKPQSQAPTRGTLVTVALCAAVALALCALVSSQRAKHKAAEQRTARAYATVTAFFTRVEELKKQAPALQRQLEGPISELKPIIAAPFANKENPQRVESAVTAVAKVEKALQDAEAGGDEAVQALESLRRHADYQKLSEKVLAASSEYNGLKRGVEAKCQTVRSMIMAANACVIRRSRESK